MVYYYDTSLVVIISSDYYVQFNYINLYKPQNTMKSASSSFELPVFSNF